MVADRFLLSCLARIRIGISGSAWFFPWDEALRYLIHDRDHAVDSVRATAKGMRINESGPKRLMTRNCS
jgi:hypothetical protein